MNRQRFLGIAGDVLIMAEAGDHFIPIAQAFEQLKLLISAQSVTGRIFTGGEQAQSPCQVGNLGLSAVRIDEHTINQDDEKAIQTDKH